MKQYFQKTWPCYLVLFLLFFMPMLLLPLLPTDVRLAIIPYEDAIFFAILTVSVITIGFYAIWRRGNGWYDFLPVAATYLFLCLALFLNILFGVSSLGLDAPASVPFILFLIPVVPQLLAVALIRLFYLACIA
ncbi:MAG: hypothetical protein ACI3XD_02975 [Oscillospiraceae bacterium]